MSIAMKTQSIWFGETSMRPNGILHLNIILTKFDTGVCYADIIPVPSRLPLAICNSQDKKIIHINSKITFLFPEIYTIRLKAESIKVNEIKIMFNDYAISYIFCCNLTSYSARLILLALAAEAAYIYIYIYSDALCVT